MEIEGFGQSQPEDSLPSPTGPILPALFSGTDANTASISLQDASPMKKMVAVDDIKLRLANAERTLKGKKAADQRAKEDVKSTRYVEITDVETDADTKSKSTKSGNSKKQSKQEGKRPDKREKAEKKEKGSKKKKKHEEPIPQDDPNDSDPSHRKPSDARKGKGKSSKDPKQTKYLTAEFKKLRQQMILAGLSVPKLPHVDTSSSSSSDNDNDSNDDDNDNDDGHKAKTKALVKSGDPTKYTYYKTLDVAGAEEVVEELKASFARKMYFNWFPEGFERVTMGKQAYREALLKWQTDDDDVIQLDSDGEKPGKNHSRLAHSVY